MSYDGNGMDWDMQDGLLYRKEEEELPYRLRPEDGFAHPMLMHGQERQRGMLEGTHSVVDRLEDIGQDDEILMADLSYIEILEGMLGSSR